MVVDIKGIDLCDLGVGVPPGLVNFGPQQAKGFWRLPILQAQDCRQQITGNAYLWGYGRVVDLNLCLFEEYWDKTAWVIEYHKYPYSWSDWMNPD